MLQIPRILVFIVGRSQAQRANVVPTLELFMLRERSAMNILHDNRPPSGEIRTGVVLKTLRQSGSYLSVFLAVGVALISCAHAQTLGVRNAAGLRMAVDAEDRDPALHVVIPGEPESERSFNILLPEHVTVRAHGQSDAKHLYIFQPGQRGVAPHWKQVGNALEYASDFGDIHFVARATLEENGILFCYEFVNHSAVDYDMAWAITDPRFIWARWFFAFNNRYDHLSIRQSMVRYNP